jgi:nitric oxide dioxygenase
MYASAPWDGFQEFKVARRVQEAERVISLDLVPVDPDMLPLKPYRAGAFVTARIWIEDLKCWQNRHYSLSDAQSSTGDHYRMTVKRVDGDSVGYCPPGLVSNALDALPVGGTVLLSAPTGSFVLPDPLPENIVFFSAGIGVTSNIAMLNAVSGENPAKGPRISWIQSMPTPDTHIFKDHVADLASRSAGKIRYKSFYTEVEGPLAIRDKDKHTHFGRVDVLALDRSLLALHDRYTHYFLCGPDPFMKDVRRDLEALGVNSKRINIEAFRAGELVD